MKKNGQAVSNVYDNNNRIVEDDKYTYAHDDSGNLIKKVNKQSGYTYKYIWDYENKLQFVTEHLTENSGTLKTHTYIYDVLGRRIMKDSNGVIRKYVYDNEDILLEFDNNDSLQAKFTHGPGIDGPVEMLKGSQKYFYHTDGLGSITALTDGNGNTVQSYSYSSFGETKVFNGAGVEINPSSMIQSPYGYTAREWDPETSQYYYRARYYDPRTGRFITPDPIGFGGGDTNLYRYVKNGSSSYRDPTGKYLIFTVTAGAISGAVGGYITGGDWESVVIGAGVGAVAGIIPGSPVFTGMLSSIFGQTVGRLRNIQTGKIDRGFDYGAIVGAGIGGGLAGRWLGSGLRGTMFSNSVVRGTIFSDSFYGAFAQGLVEGSIAGLFEYLGSSFFEDAFGQTCP